MHNINNEVINNEVDMAYLETSKDSCSIYRFSLGFEILFKTRIEQTFILKTCALENTLISYMKPLDL